MPEILAEILQRKVTLFLELLEFTDYLRRAVAAVLLIKTKARRARFSQSRSNRRHATPTDRCRSTVGIVPHEPRKREYIAICPQRNWSNTSREHIAICSRATRCHIGLNILQCFHAQAKPIWAVNILQYIQRNGRGDLETKARHSIALANRPRQFRTLNIYRPRLCQQSGARSPASAILTKPFQSPSRHTD